MSTAAGGGGGGDGVAANSTLRRRLTGIAPRHRVLPRACQTDSPPSSQLYL